MHTKTCTVTSARALVVGKIDEKLRTIYDSINKSRASIRSEEYQKSKVAELEKALSAERKKVDECVSKRVKSVEAEVSKEQARLRKLREQALFLSIKDLKIMYDKLD